MRKFSLHTISVLITLFFCSAVFANDGSFMSSTRRDKMKQDVTEFMKSLTPDQKSALQQKLQDEKRMAKNPYALSLYGPTYILPYYYTGRPYYAVYDGQTPDDQQVMHSEFKAQFSVTVPVYQISNILAVKVAYTQMSYWQFYANSQYFRETDYEPQVFLSYNLLNNWLLETGLDHQSNGHGGAYERSWNRLYANMSFSGRNWLVSVKPWMLIYKGGSSNLHNKDIADYMGHGQALFAYKYRKNVFSLMLRNNLTSWFKRGAVEATWSYPIKDQLRIYVDAFSGYGQSLIEYNHYTDSFGIGLSLNDWI